jgi:endonuclease III
MGKIDPLIPPQGELELHTSIPQWRAQQASKITKNLMEVIQYEVESQIKNIEKTLQDLVQLFWRKGKFWEEKLNKVVDLLEQLRDLYNTFVIVMPRMNSE